MLLPHKIHECTNLSFEVEKDRISLKIFFPLPVVLILRKFTPHSQKHGKMFSFPQYHFISAKKIILKFYRFSRSEHDLQWHCRIPRWHKVTLSLRRNFLKHLTVTKLMNKVKDIARDIRHSFSGWHNDTRCLFLVCFSHSEKSTSYSEKER